MIIDTHGHYTTVPKEHESWRIDQIAALEKGAPPPTRATFSDDQLRETIELKQMKLQRERGSDLTLFSPRAMGMAHHVGDERANAAWAAACNEMVGRVCALFPRNFISIAQLPQVPGISPANCIKELERCVRDYGSVACNLNPDPSGGYWRDPPLTDRWWYPLFEKMVELDVPAVIHVSASCNPNFQTTMAHYINGDTTAFVQLLTADLFKDFPTLKLIIPHGGGAVPFHWGRYRGFAQMQGRPLINDYLLKNLFFDTCVYHQPGIDLLTRVMPIENLLFASEMLGAVTGIDPENGHPYDHTKRYIDAVSWLTEADRAKIYEMNARKVFGRLSVQIERQFGAAN